MLNSALFIIEGLLAAVFILAGGTKLLVPRVTSPHLRPGQGTPR